MLGMSDRPIAEVVRQLALVGIDASYLVPTATGLDKSILDCIAPVRSYLRREGIHDFDQQSQGPAHKVKLPAKLVLADRLVDTTASLYRPNTKQGDPRIWFSGLADYARAGNLLVLIAFEGTLCVVNSSLTEVWRSLEQVGSPLRSIVDGKGAQRSGPAEELLAKLKRVSARGFIRTVRAGDTGVGATLEHALGIRANTHKGPDYQGIEIKASRRRSTGSARNRVSLFSQVPDWGSSRYKNGDELLKAHGYVRDGRRQLYCTVGTTPNSQGLYHSVDVSAGKLLHLCSRDGATEKVCLWSLETLRERLKGKHRETFWVKARARGTAEAEEFHYVEVEHTRLPLLGNLEPMLEAGQITFDYTLSAKPNGGSRDHGYLFKVWPEEFDLLFPPGRKYSLSTE